jgi:tetratricopeptide (TPR) repeat protein
MRWTLLLALCTAVPLTTLTMSGVAAAQDHDESVKSLLAQARVAQAKGDFSQAAGAYQKAVALEPAIPELWANLGLMYRESGNHSEAIKSLQHAARMKPSLFVPQLFLGLEYLQANQAAAARPYLENAVKLNPEDVQALRSLAKAHSMLGKIERATDLYRQAIRLDSNKGDLWFDLGTSHLMQVENDARLMTSDHANSAYVKLRAGEVLAEQGKLIDAEEAYKASIAAQPFPPCAFAEYGITLLRQLKTAAARSEFEDEIKTGSYCELAILGQIVADLGSADVEPALTKLAEVADADLAFVRSSLPLFRSVLTREQIKSLIDAARIKANGSSSVDLAGLMEGAFLTDDTLPALNTAGEAPSAHTPPPSLINAMRFAKEGRYSQCDKALREASPTESSTRLRLLAFCSFYSGDFPTTSLAGQHLKERPETRAEGLYWESKADQNLAIQAFGRAGEIDANSPRMHVLLGNVFREKRRWDEAETEYRKALALDPKSRSARLSLAITLFSEMKNEEAFALDESLLTEDPANAEANLLAGEILVQRNQFDQAEPYLQKCTGLQPELLPRSHALLGKVFAESGRVPEAIAEYKLGLSTDEDGSLHYQLGRLYQQSGNKAAAEEAFRQSKQLVARWNDRARVLLQQMGTDASRQ